MNCIWKVAEEDRRCEYCMYQDCLLRVGWRRPEPEEYVEVMKGIVGSGFLNGARKHEWVWTRKLIAYQMHLDGFHYEKIASLIGKDRTSINHMVDDVTGMLRMPQLYGWEMRLWREYQKMLNLRKKEIENETFEET